MDEKWVVVHSQHGMQTVYGPFDSSKTADDWRVARYKWKGLLLTQPLMDPVRSDTIETKTWTVKYYRIDDPESFFPAASSGPIVADTAEEACEILRADFREHGGVLAQIVGATETQRIR